MARGDGPFKIIEKVGDNAYKLQLPRDMAVSATFTIGNLSPYVEDYFNNPSNLRSNPFEKGEVDVEKGIEESSQDLKHVQSTN